MEARRRAGRRVRRRIRRDRDLARDTRLRAVFDCLDRDVFDEALNVDELWRRAGVADRSVRGKFREQTGKAPRDYKKERRLDAAMWLLFYTDFDCLDIGPLVGFKEYSTFNRTCQKIRGRSPLRIRQAGPQAYDWPERPDDDDVAGAAAPAQELRRGGPGDAAAGPQPFELASSGLCVVEVKIGGTIRVAFDLLRHHRYYAEGLWRDIRDLPFEQQRQLVSASCGLFFGPDLFELLRKQSRVEGRQDRQRGIEVMELALVSLEGGEPAFGPHLHDYMALGLATLANHHRLDGDRTEAIALFARSDLAWSHPDAPHDPKVAAEIAFLKAMLRTSLGSYDEALELAAEARAMFRQAGHVEGEIQSLIQIAAILGYSGRPADAVEMLLEAQGLVAGQELPYLAFAITSGLANAYGRSGDSDAAAKELARAREHLTDADYPLGTHELTHLEGSLTGLDGDLERAESLFSDARHGYLEAGDMTSLAVVDLDLALLYSEQGDWNRVLELSSEAVSMLEPVTLSRETLGALELLAEAVQSKEVSREILKGVRDRLEQDPLAHLV